MAVLKIFISHSSRLRRCDADDAQAQRNWQLLQETCALLQATYPETLEILVDYQGLKPGDDWERRLNEWLAECHAAIILFSARAIDESDWVKKEAAILSWRAAINAEFMLFPVLLDEVTPEQLAKDFFGTLRITKSQCVQPVVTAKDIVDRIQARLSEAMALRDTWSSPLESLLSTVEALLATRVGLESLKPVWGRLFPHTQAPATHADYARHLARYLFNKPDEALQRFRDVLDAARPEPDRSHAKELLKYVRSLWVDAGAAGLIAAAKSHGQCLALNGECVGKPEPLLHTEHFTLDRYLQRAWPSTDQISVIPVSQIGDADEIWAEVRRRGWRGTQRPSDERIDAKLRIDEKHRVVLLPTAAVSGEAPDPALLSDLAERASQCKSLLFIVDIGEQMPERLPKDLRPIVPPLSADSEWAQYDQEVEAQVLINDKYGLSP